MIDLCDHFCICSSIFISFFLICSLHLHYLYPARSVLQEQPALEHLEQLLYQQTLQLMYCAYCNKSGMPRCVVIVAKSLEWQKLMFIKSFHDVLDLRMCTKNVEE